MRPLSRTILKFAAAAFALTLLAQEDAVFRSDTRLVVLHATVLDKKGALLTDLKQDAFTVLENNAPQKITTFRREDVPVSMGLVIDNSGSMRDKRARVAAAALAFVKASNRDDEVFIVNFSDDAYLDVPLSSDIKRLEEGLARIDTRGGTAMRDAALMSMGYLKEKGKRDKKVLLLISDGDDTSSQPSNTVEKLISQAQQSEVLIYTIGLLADEDRSAAKRATRALKGLAQATGGLAYFPKDVAEVDEIANRVAQEIRNQYVIAYTPSVAKLDGTYRRIQVKVKASGTPTVRTRSGYYATPDEEKPKGAASSLLDKGEK
jgi:Ca-activated chloride channel homolog